MTEHPVLIAGGGPVGAIAALALARQGVAVRVFEADAAIDESPRAATTHPATLEMLADLRLIDDLIARGLVARTFQFWDRPSGQLIAEFDHAVLARDTPYPFVVQCEQHKLVNLAIERLRGFADASYEFSAQVTEAEADAHAVAVTVRRGNRTERVTGSYLIGADGGRSTVRKALGIAFEGYTFPERFLVLTTPFDFARERGCGFRSYFSDPDEWANLFKVAGNDGRGLWRVVFPTLPGETDEEIFNEDWCSNVYKNFSPSPGPIQSSTAISITSTSAWPRASATAAFFSRATQRTSTTRLAGSVSIAEFTTPSSSQVCWARCCVAKRTKVIWRFTTRAAGRSM